MSALSTRITKLVTLFAVLFALGAPNLAYAGGPAGDVARADRTEIKASKFARLSKVARAKIARAKMAGMSVAGNAAWAVALSAGAAFDAVQHNAGGVMLLGGFATYNGIQAFRKWRVEKTMNE